jgi:3-oxoacyl-[acyl-carrier-protein] synthase II
MSGDQGTNRRVVITGIGVFSPIGIGADPFWQSLKAGNSGIAPLDLFEYSAAPRNAGGEIKGFVESSARKSYLKPLRKSVKVMCREIQLGAASAIQALENSGIDMDEIDHTRLGVEFGANLMFSPPSVLQDACWSCTDDDDATHEFHFDRWGKGGANEQKDNGMAHMEPLWLLRYLPNMPACHIGIYADARGPNNSITQDSASANLVLGEAFRIIQRNAADIMITGTTGTRLHPVKSLHAVMWDQLADENGSPETWCKPFDLNREGQVLGEGACSLILEEESHAINRGATIYGRLLGVGASCVIDSAGQVDTQQALANAMRSALKNTGMKPEEIGHINAEGLGEKEADSAEARAIQQVFGENASSVPVTALKSILGNSGSGCGSLELAGSLLGLREGVVPATLNYETPDPECPLNVVHGEPLGIENKVVMNINVTRMGQASAAIVESA